MSQIHERIPKVMASIGAIGKDRRNPQQGYQFRGIDDLYNACNSALAEQEVFSVPEVIDIKREERTGKSGGALFYTILTIRYTFFASDGSSIQCITVGEAMDSGDKSCNKAMSAAQKYAFLQIFAIPTEESKDTEDETHEPQGRARRQPNKQQPPRPQQPNQERESIIETARKAFEEIKVVNHLSAHWRKHFTEYQADPRFSEITALKDKRKTELLEDEGKAS